MNNKSGLSVAIIGGGFCGVMTLVQLVKQSAKPVNITLFNSVTPHARGTAFSTYSSEHLLNVAAGNMSAFPETKNHFVIWLKSLTEYSSLSLEEISKLYVPRNFYGDYLESILEQCLQTLPNHVNCELIMAEVSSIKAGENNYFITRTDGKTLEADKVVLATGNHLPRSPFKEDHPLTNSGFYFENPWIRASVNNLSEDKPVLIIGTGLTMVDVVLGLREQNFKGKIIAVSPKGFHILPHRPHLPYTDILDEIKPPYKLLDLFKIFRKHIRKVKSENKSGETVVDALRSKTQEVWHALDHNDRKRFMTHVRHLWGVARHRLPADVYARIQTMIGEGSLEILAGRISNAVINNTTVEITFKTRKDQSIKVFEVLRVINCTGPEADPSKFRSRLFKEMLNDGLVQIDDMSLGIKADEHGRIMDANGNTTGKLFALGSLLRGTLWETTAVPELRTQAAGIAELILKK